MLELIAEGPTPNATWRRPLPGGMISPIGRAGELELAVPWDRQISRRHARLTVGDNRVEIERLPEARNPLFFDGEAVEHCVVRPGEHFVIGETRFRVISATETGSSDEPPVEEVAFDRQELRKVRFRDADKRIEVLSHLPEVIWGARTETELYNRLGNLILTGVLNAEAVAIVALDEERDVRVLHWDRRRETAGGFRPSSRLVRDALQRQRRSVLHVWHAQDKSRSDYTEMAEFDWAFCTPVLQGSREPWGLYVAGRLDLPQIESGRPPADHVFLHADVKFTELVAEIIGSVQRLNSVERKLSGLRQFFAPPVLAALGGLSAVGELNTDPLEPRECDVTVMFCDLRGFSRRAEESAGDLIGLLNRVSRAFEVMTDQILQQGGVPCDFQGDAALGFWGWPFASDDAPLNACRAALGIHAAFAEMQRRSESPLADFQLGIGIAHGRAVAGKIGTSEQVKVTVFGPVVNLASRLEGMTKVLRVPIVLDEATARMVRPRLVAGEGRLRTLAKVLPYGMETPVVVSELLPPESERGDLTDEQLAIYERGVAHFIEGRWEEAYRCLHAMPAGDRAQDFLGMLIAQHNRIPPSDWDGVVRLPSK